MFGILLTLLVLDGILLMVVVLLQAGKGGGLAAMGGGGGAGTDSFMGGRQATTVLTKSTWVSSGVFLVLALVLSIMSSQRTDSAPLLQDEFRTQPVQQPQPVLPGGDGAPAGGGDVAPGAGGGTGPAGPGGENPDGQ